MATKDFDYIEYDENLFRLQFETPLAERDPESHLEETLDTISAVFDAFANLVCPTEVNCQLTEGAESTRHEETLSNPAGLTHESVVEWMRGMADQIDSPEYPKLTIASGVRITLSDGVHYFGKGEHLSDGDELVRSARDVSAPLEITVGHNDYMMPCLTETVTVTGYSDHWLDGDIEKFYLPEAPPLAKLDQSRLAAALSNLYDAVDPVEIVFDTFENTEGWHTPEQAVPAYQSLEARHAIEWVLENFKQRQPDENSLELEYLGDELHPLIAHTQGRSPDEKVQQFLWKAIPEERFGKGATATVTYSHDEAVFVREARNWWSVKS
jgi:hypothetical protein